MSQAKNPALLPDASSLKKQVEAVVGDLPGRLRAFRESLGLTQREFADLIGVAETTAYRLESGQTQPNFYTYTAILLLGFEPPTHGQGRPSSVFDAYSTASDPDDGEAGLWSGGDR